MSTRRSEISFFCAKPSSYVSLWMPFGRLIFSSECVGREQQYDCGHHSTKPLRAFLFTHENQNYLQGRFRIAVWVHVFVSLLTVAFLHEFSWLVQVLADFRHAVISGFQLLPYSPHCLPR